MTAQKNSTNQRLLSTAHFEYQKGLNAHAYFKVNSRETSQDLVQDTFLKTWAFLVRGGKIEIMKAFLYHVLNNLIVDQYRKHKTVSLDTLAEEGYEPAAETDTRLIDQLDGKDAQLLINRLPAKYQKIMKMKYVQDLSVTEMSLLTKQTKNTVSVQLHRGLIMLKQLYLPVLSAK